MRLSIFLSAAVVATAALAGLSSAQAAPSGSYTNSCRNASERGGTLYAECRDSSGRYRSTSLSLRGCSGDIANSGGNLYCSNDRYSDNRYDNRYDRRDDRNNGCNTALGTGIGALGGAGIGAAINRGNDTGAAIAGGIIGAIIGNKIAKNNCNDDDYDAYYYERGRYDTVYNGRPGRWRNPHTGAYGEFRIVRTYNDYGTWNNGRWSRVSDREYRRNRKRYSQVQCREYVETYRGPRGNPVEQTRVVCRDGNTWRIAG